MEHFFEVLNVLCVLGIVFLILWSGAYKFLVPVAFFGGGIALMAMNNPNEALMTLIALPFIAVLGYAVHRVGLWMARA